jgi:hypothetical protein
MDAYNAQCSNVMQGSDDETRCRALRAELSAAIERHVGASQRFSNAVTQAISDRTVDLERQIESVRAKIRADKESFRRLGIDTVRDAFEDWEKLTDGQRREFIKGTVLSGISASFQVVKEAGGPIGSFTPAKANGWISYFRSKGVTEPFIEEGLRKIGMTAGKPAMRAAVQDFADHIEKGIATGGALNELSNGQLEALAAIPGAFLKTPDAKGAAALGEAFVNFYFAEKAMGAIEVDMNQVIGVPEKQLVAVGNLAATMTKDVTELNTLKDELNQISGTRSATDQAVGNR